MKKLISILSLLLTVCMLLTACGNSSSSNDFDNDFSPNKSQTKQTTSQAKQTQATKDTEKSTKKETEACDHEWEKANCTTPNTCFLCGKTSGEALGHDWKEATCTSPKTCSKCNKTEGEKLEHNWAEATCTTPKTCLLCQTTEGTVTHKWQNATCVAPKTCSDCKLTSGNIIPQNHIGTENCNLCEKNYKEIFKNYIFTKGTQIKSNSTGDTYWNIKHSLSIKGEFRDLSIQYVPKADYISIDLIKDDSKESISFGICLYYTSCEYKIVYYRNVKTGTGGGDLVFATVSADSFTPLTNKITITSILCHDGYHSEAFFAEQMATDLKDLLTALNSYLTTKSVGVTINQLGFTNYN